MCVAALELGSDAISGVGVLARNTIHLELQHLDNEVLDRGLSCSPFFVLRPCRTEKSLSQEFYDAVSKTLARVRDVRADAADR
jgi:hypothetical protein